jgi:hypothetical protein
MSNPFEDFVQLELPRRPFLPVDAEPESIFIRRGNGPRQMSSIKLEDGQVLGMVDGMLVGISANRGVELDAVVHVQENEQNQWTIVHNKNNRNVFVTMYNTDGVRFEADAVQALDNTIQLTMNVAVSGHAVVLFVPPSD